MAPLAPLAWSVESRSVQGTESLGRRLGESAVAGTVFALVGDLGAGKTALVRGLARGLGVPDMREVVSPTYALMNVYPGGRLPLVHIDLYRFEEGDGESARALGMEEQILRSDAVLAVEWADRIPELFDAAAIRITLTSPGGAVRRATVRGMAKPKGLRLRAVDVDVDVDGPVAAQ